MSYIVDFEDAKGEIQVEDFGGDLDGAKKFAAKKSKEVGSAYVIRYSGSAERGTYIQHGQAVYVHGRFSHTDDAFEEAA